MTMGWDMIRSQPPIAGMPIEVWTWLRESRSVRPHVVARVRAALAAGLDVTSYEVAAAILRGPFRDVA